MCGHSLEVNVTSSLDFYLSIAQVHLLHQLLRDNMVGMDAPEKGFEVHYTDVSALHTKSKPPHLKMFKQSACAAIHSSQCFCLPESPVSVSIISHCLRFWISSILVSI